jgi:hypothetical protein
MTGRFHADADLNAEMIPGVQRREPSIDFQMADEASLRQLRDPEILRTHGAREAYFGHARPPYKAIRDDGRLPMADHNARIIVLGRRGVRQMLSKMSL